MDLNTEIIEAVRQYPSLHGSNNSLEERNRAWLKLSEKLKMEEQHLKIRWHSLVQHYQRDENFKYAGKMQFLERKRINSPEHVGNWPEFVITEEDLRDRNRKDKEEFVFMELDEYENNNKEIKTEPGEEMQYNNQIKTNQQDMQIRNIKAVKNPNIEKKSPIMSIQSAETLNNNSLPTKSVEKIRSIVPIKIVHSKSLMGLEPKKLESNPIIEVQPPIVKPNKSEPQKEESKIEEPKKADDKKEECKKEETKMVESPPAPTPPPPPPATPVLRCEDDIFGELVSAMLKRMDETKKKNVKKEIMNLLLT